MIRCNFIKKADVILAIALIVAGLLLSYALSVYSVPGSQVQISLNGSVYGTYPLNENNTIRVEQNGHLNIITIQDGQVYMSHSDCPNQVCVRQGAISKTGQSIVCLPNRVAVTIIGPNQAYDTTTY